MNDQSTNSLQEDAAKQRRDYVLKVARAYLLILAVVVVMVAILLLFGIGFNAVWQKMLGMDVIGALVMLLLFLPLPVAVLVLGLRNVRHNVNAAQTISYVPPVHKQISNLAAEEILLRGAVQPMALPAELLRSARLGTDAEAAETLLRSTNSGA